MSCAARVDHARGWGGLAVTLGGAVAVFWAFDALPFMDLPAHAGLIALRRDLLSSPFEQRYYVLATHFGAYSLFRGLGDLLARALGPVGAVRALATLSVVALPLSLLDARRRLHGEASPASGFAGIILGFGLMTLFGFATYMLGVAGLVTCMALWLELLFGAHPARSPRPWWGRALAVAAASALLFVTHGFAFVLFLTCAGLTWLVAVASARSAPAGEAHDRPAASLASLATLLPAVSLAAYAAWVERSESVPPGASAAPQPRTGLLFQPLLDKLSLLATPTLMTRTGLDLVVGAAVWAIAIASLAAAVTWLRRHPAPGAPGGRRARDCTRALLACEILLAAAFCAMPHEIGWFGFVDARLLLVLLVFALLCVPPDAIGPRLAAARERALPALACVVVALALVTSYRFQGEAGAYREVLARVPPFTRLLNLPEDPNSDVFTGHPFVHYDKLVLADRPVLVSDLWFHQGSGVYPRPGNPVLRLPADYVTSNLRPVDWGQFDLSDWDYVLVRTRPSAPPPAAPASLRLATHSGGWWLYATGALTDGRR